MPQFRKTVTNVAPGLGLAIHDPRVDEQVALQQLALQQAASERQERALQEQLAQGQRAALAQLLGQGRRGGGGINVLPDITVGTAAAEGKARVAEHRQQEELRKALNRAKVNAFNQGQTPFPRVSPEGPSVGVDLANPLAQLRKVAEGTTGKASKPDRAVGDPAGALAQLFGQGTQGVGGIPIQDIGGGVFQASAFQPSTPDEAIQAAFGSGQVSPEQKALIGQREKERELKEEELERQRRLEQAQADAAARQFEDQQRTAAGQIVSQVVGEKFPQLQAGNFTESDVRGWIAAAQAQDPTNPFLMEELARALRAAVESIPSVRERDVIGSDTIPGAFLRFLGTGPDTPEEAKLRAQNTLGRAFPSQFSSVNAPPERSFGGPTVVDIQTRSDQKQDFTPDQIFRAQGGDASLASLLQQGGSSLRTPPGQRGAGINFQNIGPGDSDLIKAAAERLGISLDRELTPQEFFAIQVLLSR